MSKAIKLFTKAGAKLFIKKNEFVERLNKIKVIAFDWDGVFNMGNKNIQKVNDFYEQDAMGLNMLRFGLWLKNGKIPYSLIVTGSINENVQKFINREHFDGMYFKFFNKIDAIKHYCNNLNISLDEVGFVFDDIIDLSMAKEVGLRFMIKNNSNLITREFVIKNKMVDYITANTSGNFAVREVCELILDSLNIFDSTVKKRIAFGEEFKNYNIERLRIQPKSFLNTDEGIVLNDKFFV